jgi:hypothetical protein
MADYYLNVDGDAPYNHSTSLDETGSLVLPDHGACRNAPRIISVHEADLIARNREIVRIPLSWVT